MMITIERKRRRRWGSLFSHMERSIERDDDGDENDDVRSTSLRR